MDKRTLYNRTLKKTNATKHQLIMENFLEKDISIQKLELWDESPRLRRKCVGMDEWVCGWGRYAVLT